MKQIAHKYWLKAICKTSECKTNKHWMLCYRSPVHKTATVSNGKWWVVRAPQPTRTNSQQPVDCLYFFFNILGEWSVRLPICGVCLLRDKQNRCQSVVDKKRKNNFGIHGIKWNNQQQQQYSTSSSSSQLDESNEKQNIFGHHTNQVVTVKITKDFLCYWCPNWRGR